MNVIRFNSILNSDKFGFVFEPSSTEHLDRCYRTSNLLSYHSFYFETLGDGRTQHTPLIPVSSPDIQLDWMLSLAQHLANHPEEYGYPLNSLFGYGTPSVETAQFLASIKEPKESDPTVYYSVNERKVSKNESKRHDKRWFQLDSHAFRKFYDLDRYVCLFNAGQEPRSRSIIEWHGLYFAMADALNTYVSYSASDCMQKWTNEEILKAAKILRQIIKALELQDNAKDSIQSVIGNHLRAKQTATQAVA